MRQYKLLIRNNFASIAVTAFLIILMSLAMTFAGYSLTFFFTAYEYEGDKIEAICSTFVIVTAIWRGVSSTVPGILCSVS